MRLLASVASTWQPNATGTIKRKNSTKFRGKKWKSGHIKVFPIHEYYPSSSSSGEYRAFDREKELLQQNGLTVESFIFMNDLIGTKYGPSVFKTALYTPWSPIKQKTGKEAVHRFSPNIVHFYNTFLVWIYTIWNNISINYT